MDNNNTSFSRHNPRLDTTASVAEDPLGMLAALASPPPATTKTRSTSLATNSSLTTGASTTSGATVEDKPDMHAKSTELSTPVIELSSPKNINASDSQSTSPRTTPSRQASLLKSLSDPSMASEVETSVTTARPNGIPATQLDVLALVTATSPPMPSRRRWGPHGTQKSTFLQIIREVPTTANTTRLERPENKASDSDTVSEDELTLRAYSTRQKSKYEDSRMPLLTLASSQPTGTSSVRAVKTKPFIPLPDGQTRHQPDIEAARIGYQVDRHRYTGLKRKGKSMESSGSTTDTDDDASSARQPHFQRRGALSGYPPRAAPSSSDNVPFGLFDDSSRPAPANELVLCRSSRVNMNNISSEGGLHSKRGSRLSISPPVSPSQRQRSLRTRRSRKGRTGQKECSDTETDTELATRPPGSDTETDRSISTHGVDAVSEPISTQVNYKRHTDGMAMSPIHTLNSMAEIASAASRMVAPNFSLVAQHARLPPIAQSGLESQRRDQGARGATSQDSDGDTTETDDEFFGPSRVAHARAAGPLPRRVVRHITSAHGSQQQQDYTNPSALQLPGPRLPRLLPRPFDSNGKALSHEAPEDHQSAYQSYTPPAANFDSSNSGLHMGLGINSGGSGQLGVPGSGQLRILSTPSLAAGPELAAAVQGVPPSSHAGFNGQPMLPPAQIPTPVHSQAQPPRDASLLHNSSMRREFVRDPFAPISDEFTFKGAALRRLEKSHVRGTPNGGRNNEYVSRKRALTAPSLLEPPARWHGQYGPSDGPFNSNTSMLDDDNTSDYSDAIGHNDIVMGDHSACESEDSMSPKRSQQQSSGGHRRMLGASPMSSLRSSLFARAEPRYNHPGQQQQQPHVWANGSASNSHSDLEAISADSYLPLIEEGTSEGGMSIGDDPTTMVTVSHASPGMGAGLHRGRKRGHSAIASTASSQSISPLNAESVAITHMSHRASPIINRGGLSVDNSGSPRSAKDALPSRVDPSAS
ncbi:hypothetical protein BX661DRAFT_41873 [Kickxella alabastrina]|uniref:uncharacterized protein n=1 Tax=Kickxella alabastrina TaxID=61397 RepID=UPI002220651B|nr:uncharacterized protein BX661DRAFT_41873 [Kickxella alabastrina]KAI7824968.1 hypothetical protein BX661DRAFT_41873 [Kickxella alabastrina]